MSDLCISTVTLSAYARANTHFAEAKKVEGYTSFGHRLIGVIEMVPILGLVVALIDWIACKIFSSQSEAGNLGGGGGGADNDGNCGGNLATVFSKTWKDVKAGFYTKDGTKIEFQDKSYKPSEKVVFFRDQEHAELPKVENPHATTYTVKNKDTISSVLDIAKREGVDSTKIGLLNLANEHSAGGGVKGGALAQEEDICRCSTLYTYLEHARGLELNKRERFIPEHGCIASPTVIFKNAKYKYLEKPVEVQTITTAGYYLGSESQKKALGIADGVDVTVKNADAYPLYRDGTKAKIRMSLKAAVDQGVEYLVLGALGCGAFRKDPEFVAGEFHAALNSDEFKGRFKEVHFGILAREGKPHEARNYATYQSKFS